MPKNTLYSAAEVIKVAHECHGVILEMARKLDVTPVTIYSYRDRWKTVDAAIEEARRGMIDEAEKTMMEAVREGDRRAAAFVLARLGKDRGWTERTEIAPILANENINVTRTVVDHPDDLKELEE